MDGSVTLSLQEVIASGCISESTFIFDHEDVSQISGLFKHKSRDQMRHLNATKISFLLTKAFCDRFSAIHEDSLASLRPSNIFVQLKCCLQLDVSFRPEPADAPMPALGKEPADSTHAYLAHRSSSSSPSNNSIKGRGHMMEQGGTNLYQQSPPSSASSFDVAIDNIFIENDAATHEDESKNTHQNEDSTVSIVDDETKKNYSSLERTWIPISDVARFQSIDQGDMCKLYCTLMSVGIIFERLNDDASTLSTEVNESVALQIIGKLIDTIFSIDKQPLSIAHELDSADATHGRSLPHNSKLRRNKDGTLFSSLVESGHYPISICRLLSDMIDIGPNGKADSPVASFDEVIHDLEQMSLYPETFLYDPENGFYSRCQALLFGQTHCGREAEVTKMLEISTRLEQSDKPPFEDILAETVFITGIAGCGKTHIARRVGNFLSSLGWLVVEEKFDRLTEHQTPGAVSVFDKLVSKLIDMKHNSKEKDVEFAARVEEAISDTFDSAGLSALANVLPSIHNFLGVIETPKGKKESNPGGQDKSHWQLIILLSKFIGSILRLDRFIMICLNDLQWCDPNVLTLINEIVISVSQHEQEKQHLLFVGTYRRNEIDDAHPLTNWLANLQSNKSVNVTQINLSGLSKDEVCHMLMTEMRLPRRLVSRLASVVHKKTSGHAIFIIEFLRLLLRESTIVYSPELLRFGWDPSKVSDVKTGHNVASLIISNLTSLQPSDFWTLCVISCFGFKSETSLFRLLRESGSSLPSWGLCDLENLVDKGFIDTSGPVVSFSHDLIQQHIYEKMPLTERQQLHLDIGMTLAAKSTLESTLSHQPIVDGVEKLYVCDGWEEYDDDSPASTLSLSGIATSQINKAGPEFVSDRTQRIRFAGWNLHASNESAANSNFRAALYYCKNGILFLGDDPWHNETCQLGIELHEGAAFNSFAVGNVTDVAEYANAIIDSEHVDFEQSLAAHCMVLRSLESMGRYADTITRGLAVLRRLNFDFDIPNALSHVIIIQTMNQTSSIATHYLNFNVNSPGLPQIIHSKQKNILKIIDSVAVSCFLSASPYLPLVACATIIYSLQQGIFHCEESASAFAIFGYFRVLLEGDLAAGQQWGDFAIAAIGNSNGHASARARIYLFGFLYFWYIPIKETCRRLHETYTLSMRCGDVDSAMYALCLEWKFQFFGGCKLSIVLSNYVEYMKSVTNYSKELTKQAVLGKINLNELIGISDEDPFLLLEVEGAICNEDVLLIHAKLKNNIQLIEAVHLTRFISAFWMGDFATAMESFKLMAELPSSKMPKIQFLYYTCYRGIAAYQLYREGNGEHFFIEGNEVLSKVQSWRKMCKHVENKLLLLQAEYFASQCNSKLAKEKYDASISAARDHGFVHEQGLAYECMGKYLSSIIDNPGAVQCFRRAHECYMQWGALGKAKQIQRDHILDQEQDNSDQERLKRERDWDGII